MRYLLPALLFSLIAVAITAQAADKGRWVKLGSLHVTDRTDKDDEQCRIPLTGYIKKIDHPRRIDHLREGQAKTKKNA